MSQITLLNIDMYLTPESIQDAIDKVNDLKDHLANALSELARMLTEDQGPRVAQMYIAQFPAVDTGALSDSIAGEYNASAHEGVITTGVMYAVYVEYGTGIVGAQNPHPEAGEAGYSYDVNNHGSDGWWYPSSQGWIQGKEGGLLAWTQGMPSRPFMYNTLRELERIAESEGGQIIAKYIP